MTIFYGIHMVLAATIKVDFRSMQDVIDCIEAANQQQAGIWGMKKYCTEHSHTCNNNRGRRCHAPLEREHCAQSCLAKRLEAGASHTTANCISFALRGPEVAATNSEALVERLGSMSVDY
ncbi:hypothetical protein EK21DRAFT_93560 [Setomelanomma holmii]|uniref:Uncharacterized protein n=1 Tax=Setomelanomma holmii TaxID=210430 RepID=A0A9P4LHD5_9PLEO|nr:hypothetical protein EK21DRAFT_93560 [Setomelanomma holmii]